ncbi:hypothetical protein RI543_000749 [Arxiozyma heterogenica]|uniref:Uncharacterized protein n=1 Tax=Arxiozyma heterogenica TaxID=278026 RepID=A0AAN7WSH6_9SACH|nr:hypothetical protein RI543_000749 [Kazachstania heterogenica]
MSALIPIKLSVKVPRILIGFDVVLGLSYLCYKLTIPESPKYFFDINVQLTPTSMSTENNVML